eukprot:UN07750
MIKKHKSTVLQVAWHPNSQVLATVCTDFRCRIVSATVPQVDKTPAYEPMASPLDFGAVYAEFNCSGWAIGCAWSPSGKRLCFTGQDSSVQIVTFSDLGQSSMQVVRYPLLPVGSVHFLSDYAIVAAGHDMAPLLFTRSQSDVWSFTSNLDSGKANNNNSKKADTSKIQASRAMFQSKASRGQETSTGNGI